MTQPLSVNAQAQARDVSFEFNNSCNCFGWCKSGPSDNTQVYINSDGVAVKFDAKKATDEIEANRKTIERLLNRIDEMAEQHNKETEEVLKKLKTSSKVNLDPENPQPVSAGVVRRLNAAYKDLFQ